MKKILCLFILLTLVFKTHGWGQTNCFIPDSIFEAAKRFVFQLSDLVPVNQKAAILEIVPDSVFMECYIDKSHGGNMSKSTVSENYERIFDDSFFNVVSLLANDSKELRKNIICADGEWLLSINIQYPYSEPFSPGKEYSRLFKISLSPKGCSLRLVQCAG